MVEIEESAPKKNAKSHRGPRGLRMRDLLDLAYASVWPWLVLFVIGLTILLTPGLNFRIQEFELGQVSPITLRAPIDFSYEDEVTTEARRVEAGEAVHEIFDFNDGAMTDARSRIASAFELGREALGITARGVQSLLAANDGSQVRPATWNSSKQAGEFGSATPGSVHTSTGSVTHSSVPSQASQGGGSEANRTRMVCL